MTDENIEYESSDDWTDDLFNLPEATTDDPRLRHLYIVLTEKMKREVSHLSLPTNHYMLIERIVYSFIITRDLERQNRTSPTSPSYKAFNQHWLSLVQELNRLVVKADQQKHSDKLAVVLQLIMSVLSTVKDVKERETLKQRMANVFEEAGVL